MLLVIPIILKRPVQLFVKEEDVEALCMTSGLYTGDKFRGDCCRGHYSMSGKTEAYFADATHIRQRKSALLQRLMKS